MKQTRLLKTLLAAVCLFVGTSSVWAYTETLTGGDTGKKDEAIAKTSFTLLGNYKPDDGARTINSKSCMKVRWNQTVVSTGNAAGFALKVNAGYMITKVVAQFSGNGKSLTLGDIVIDGNNYAGNYTTNIPSNDQYAEITLSGIAATNYINFTKNSGEATQGYVHITVTYVKVNEWDFTDSGIWGNITLPTDESKTKNYQYNGVEGTSLNYVTFYSSDGSGLRHPSTLTNGIGFSKTGSTTDHYVKLSVPAGSTAIVTANCTSNRRVKVYFNGAESEPFTGDFSDVTKEFANTTGGALDLYVYCFQNADGDSKPPYLKKIVMKQTVQVTTNFVDEEDNVVKTATVENVEVGSTYSTTYDATYYKNNTDPYKYTYVSGAASGVTINAAAEYTVVYHKGERASYTLNVTQSYGAKSQKLINSQSVLEGASLTYYYPKFILDGTTLYEYVSSTDPGASGSYWYGTISNMSANKEYTLTYNAKDGVCVYYSEGENVTGKSGEYIYSAWRNYMSNNSSGAFDQVSPALANLGKGTYSITARVIGRASDRYVNFYKSSTSGDQILSAVSANAGKESSEDFSLMENTDIVVSGGYVSQANGHGLDYVYIMKTGEVATISSVGYATFSSTYALDFTAVDNAKAYIVTEKSGNSIKLQEVTGKVAAGTGMILKSNNGGEANVTIPVTTDEGTYYDLNSNPINYLFALDGSYLTLGAANPGTNYVLTVQEEKVVFAPIGKTTAAVKAGQAALWLPASAGAKALTLSFADDITGINEVGTIEPKAGKIYYNLQGQRVSEPKEGIYVVEGKKVLVNKMSH